uniref:GYF domain-containing protein n=1 Tax=Bursaphelenchus xylophilus TaxID=6326 RepID=A0A1I7SWG7_BURXY
MSNSEVAQNSFNPSWMQTSAPKTPRPNGISRAAEEDTGEMIEPVFAKYRYGREDILALNPRDSKPPDGLEGCPFFMEKALTPIILTELNETELRLQQNINSSKALSAAHRADWQGKEVESPGSGTNAWTVAGSKNSSFRSSNRWTTVGASPSTETRSAKFPFSNRGNYGSAANGEKKPKPNPWTEGKRLHQTSGSDEGNGTPNGAEPDLSADVWGSSWRSVESKSEHKRGDSSKKEGPESYARGFGRGASAWNNVESVWTAPDIGLLGDNVENLSIRTEQQEQSHLKESSDQSSVISNPPSQNTPPDQWYYLDPNGVQRGPFETKEMQAWFLSGYFHADLQIMKPGDAGYTPLGELIKSNGALTPFVEKKRSQKVTQSPPATSQSQLRNSWQPSNSSSATNDFVSKADMSIEQIKAIEEKERALVEEQRRLKEREDMIKREEQERMEWNRKMEEKEMELRRKQEEIQRFAVEKEQELEKKRREVLEYEQQRREELQKFEEERRILLIQEEQEKRKFAEMEFVRQEQERQRSMMEIENKKRLEEEMKRRREAELLAEEQQRRQREHELQREQAERIRRQQEDEAQRLQQQARAAQAASASAASSKAPWSNSTKKQKIVPAEDLSSKTLLEIQMEEERQLLKKLEEEEKVRQTEALNKKPVWSSQSGSAWSVPKNVPQPVPIPPAKEVSKQVKAEKKKPPAQKKETHADKPQDPLTAWVIQRVRQLNPSVEPDIFATFLLSIESPNEVEDYVLTYFGENKNAKEFHQEFLAKRIELRPRRRVTDKDDLSGPAAAATNIAGNGASATGLNAGGSAKTKKNKKGKKVIDGLILGFRPAGDPNRLNVGEIDTTPPAPLKRR